MPVIASRRSPRTVAAALTVVLAASAAGCSSSTGGTSSAPPTSAPATTASSTAAGQPSAPPASPTSSPSPTLGALTGKWAGSYSGAYTGVFNLTWVESSGKLAGTIDLSTAGTVPLTGSVSGSSITFGTVGTTAITYTGTVSGDTMSGTYQVGGSQHGSWRAHRTS